MEWTPYEFPIAQGRRRLSEVYGAGIEAESHFDQAGGVVIIYIPGGMEKRAEKAFAGKPKKRFVRIRKELDAILDNVIPWAVRGGLVAVVVFAAVMVGKGAGAIRARDAAREAAEDRMIERVVPAPLQPAAGWLADVRDTPTPTPEPDTHPLAGVKSFLGIGTSEDPTPAPTPTPLPTPTPKPGFLGRLFGGD